MCSTGQACQILMKFEYSRQISKITQISKFIKMHAVGVELFRADGRTDGRTDRQI